MVRFSIKCRRLDTYPKSIINFAGKAPGTRVMKWLRRCDVPIKRLLHIFFFIFILRFRAERLLDIIPFPSVQSRNDSLALDSHGINSPPPPPHPYLTSPALRFLSLHTLSSLNFVTTQFIEWLYI